MTLVSSVLSPQQIAVLKALQDIAIAANQETLGVWRPVYDKLYEFITLDGAPVAGVDHKITRDSHH